MMYNSTPRLPRALLHILTVSDRTFVRDLANGGQSRPVDSNVQSFYGVILPITNKDLRFLPEGSYTKNSQKLYTDDPVEIKTGQIIRDTYDGQLYMVKEDLGHTSIHTMMRYVVEGDVK